LQHGSSPIRKIPTGYHSTIRFLERVAEALGIPATVAPPAGPGRAPDCSFLSSRHIAIISGPTRAVSLVRFLAEYNVVPRLVVVDFDSSIQEKIRCLGLPAGEVLIEPDHELIVQKLKEHKIDLLIGGMLEQPMAKALSIDHIDIMHGSQRTIGFVGAHNLARLLGRKSRDIG
jgi:nitrogenase molybdenum-iron protein alpha/beta subunit